MTLAHKKVEKKNLNLNNFCTELIKDIPNNVLRLFLFICTNHFEFSQ